jgi:DNA-binding NarL/FixJ family response regulator
MSTLAVPIVVLDDHRMVVLGLRTLFHSRPEIEVVAWAHDAESALAACREYRPRVAVLDVALEGSEVDGIDLTRRLHEELPQVAVVVYTGMDELGLAEKAFAAGAQGVARRRSRPTWRRCGASSGRARRRRRSRSA